MTRPSVPAAEPRAVRLSPRLPTSGPAERDGPIERFMGALIRKLAWSRLSEPRVAIAVSGAGLLLGMLVAAMAPNAETLPLRLPLSTILPPLTHTVLIPTVLLYAGDILACLGLAGMLWAHSQGWRPDPRHLVMGSAAIVAVMVSLTPVGSSDTASYAAYGREAALGINPYLAGGPGVWLHDPGYLHAIGQTWVNTPSVYGPFATAIQAFAGSIGGSSVVSTVWVLMILNGAVFLGTGWFLLKTSDDPVRATLFWTANPVLIQQLVGGGHLDTIVAAAAICSIQIARRVTRTYGDLLVGVLIGLACGIKIYAVLIGVGLALPMLLRREYARTARITVVALATLVLSYSFYGIVALRPLFGASREVILPSPWRLVQIVGNYTGIGQSTMSTAIGFLWPIAMLAVAWLIVRRISADQPREVVAPFALTFAWVLTAPWVMAWYTAVPWIILTQVPRNRMTRWLTLVTVLLALWFSNGGHGGTLF